MPVLAYWKTRGLGQSIRCLLTYVGEDFVNKTYEVGEGPEFSLADWTDVKGELAKEFDFPNLPYYMDGEVKLTQSNSILRHIARKHKLDGDTDCDKAVVDMLLEQAMDLRNGMIKVCYNKDYENLKEEYFKNVQASFATFEKKLGNNDWFAGNKVTVADFPLYELLYQHREMKFDSLDAYPKLTAFLSRFHDLPKIKEYLETDYIQNLPINNKMAAFKK